MTVTPPIKTICFSLLFLCVLDTLITNWGLLTDQIKEINPIMNFIYFELGISIFFIVKLGLPVLLLFIHKMIRSIFLYIGLLITTCFYIIILFLHIHWIFVAYLIP
ncbi:DUF5658 family protein [Ammoniphilus resinae]|uniref:DUF5658 domain-containing protein n=1 Tax=Ammoniphilus resinae TaxID=861532 RepID=A0ABS4GIY4_9BACL|nr:hypothetical protein [Ammoniphilus resinae]